MQLLAASLPAFVVFSVVVPWVVFRFALIMGTVDWWFFIIQTGLGILFVFCCIAYYLYTKRKRPHRQLADMERQHIAMVLATNWLATLTIIKHHAKCVCLAFGLDALVTFVSTFVRLRDGTYGDFDNFTYAAVITMIIVLGWMLLVPMRRLWVTLFAALEDTEARIKALLFLQQQQRQASV
jgi:hypothetical protein